MKRLVLLTLCLVSACGLLVGQNGTKNSNPPGKDLSDALRAEGNHQVFLTLMEIAGFNFTDELRTAVADGVICCRTPITIFAPNDAAFAKLPNGSVEALKKDRLKLRQFLLSHFVEGKLMIADMLVPLKDDPKKTFREVKNLSGAKISILCDDHSGEHHPRLNGVARIGKGDILFSGGVIHEVDNVLSPQWGGF